MVVIEENARRNVLYDETNHLAGIHTRAVDRPSKEILLGYQMMPAVKE
jgi:hypothetical protein